MKTYDHRPFGDGTIEVPEDKKIQDMLVESADGLCLMKLLKRQTKKLVIIKKN